MIVEIVSSVLILIGAAFALIGSIGLWRMPDFFTRLHGPTKATTLGVGAILLASAIHFSQTGAISVHEVLVTIFLFITAPVERSLAVTGCLAPALASDRRYRPAAGTSESAPQSPQD